MQFPGMEATKTIYYFSGEVGIVAGWGRLSEGGKLPNILQYVSTWVGIIDITHQWNTDCPNPYKQARQSADVCSKNIDRKDSSIVNPPI